MGVNDKVKKKREGFNPNIKGDPAVNVRTDEASAAEVPATKQSDITPKKKDQETRDPSE